MIAISESECNVMAFRITGLGFVGNFSLDNLTLNITFIFLLY